MTREEAFEHFERQRDAAHLTEYLADRAAQHEAEDEAHLPRLIRLIDRNGGVLVGDGSITATHGFPVGFVHRHTFTVYRHGVRQVRLRRDLWVEAA